MAVWIRCRKRLLMGSYDFSFTSLQDQLDALRESFDSASAAIARELDQARAAAADLKGAEDGVAAKLQHAEERIAAQDELIETLNQELQDARALRKDVRERELEIERMRSELKTKNELVGTVRKQVDKANDRNKELQQKASELAEKNREAARVWISGLEAVARKMGLQRVVDLSATPFFLKGSGYREGTLFPWVVSDFSLIDAIESGLVKVPRVPVADGFDFGQDV